ncbi:5-(carboxyamino)imidazole ribonucleotide synthase [Altericroceibacterium xinjiangense]|uniref:5-(carboxyamino)imidazole ribonucleotide synthase n=1 Tax=Altericroceibacterium xinjiangense TaxID=762261 RepID=UPI000F7E4A75|nr:5-(carboxyamino)imidazole ribonucleotide synthase [Altericroceibacterium xinjiangense]
MILPGATIGILGGGQLGRMLATAAAQLGYKCHVFAPDTDSVAASVSDRFTRAEWDSPELIEFARQCDVVTYEFENVPVAPLEKIADKLAPGTRALEVAQDRLAEKRFVTDLGGRPAPFAPVNSRADLDAAIARIGTPGILKTRREGYDGKGQWRIGSAEEAAGLDLSGNDLIYEGFVRFEAEFSVILVRGRDGEVRFWDSPHNEHESGILARSTLPAHPSIGPHVEPARQLARKVADALGYVGVLTLEFFACADGPVFNEMAPRVHNSGHWTIEGAITSQFENHVRAILGLPLGDTGLTAPRVEMRNLIGRDIERAAEILAKGDTHLHHYGKGSVREGRKMGHVTRLVRA